MLTLCHHTITLIGDLVLLSSKDATPMKNFRATCKEFENLTNHKWTRYCIQTLKDSLEELKSAACDISDAAGCEYHPHLPGMTRWQCRRTEAQWARTPDSLLPQGWERYTRHGITYYVDHNRTSIYEALPHRPRCLWLHSEFAVLRDTY